MLSNFVETFQRKDILKEKIKHNVLLLSEL